MDKNLSTNRLKNEPSTNTLKLLLELNPFKLCYQTPETIMTETKEKECK